LLACHHHHETFSRRATSFSWTWPQAPALRLSTESGGFHPLIGRPSMARSNPVDSIEALQGMPRGRRPHFAAWKGGGERGDAGELAGAELLVGKGLDASAPPLNETQSPRSMPSRILLDKPLQPPPSSPGSCSSAKMEGLEGAVTVSKPSPGPLMPGGARAQDGIESCSSLAPTQPP